MHPEKDLLCPPTAFAGGISRFELLELLGRCHLRQADRPGRYGLLPLPFFSDPLPIRAGLVAGLYSLAQLGRPYAVLMPIHADLAQGLGYAPAILPFDDGGDRGGRAIQGKRAVGQAARGELIKQRPKMGGGGADCGLSLGPSRIVYPRC